MQRYHSSVLLREVLESLGVERGCWYIDGTLGDGGYTLEILRRGGKVVGIDVDPEAIERARKRLEDEGFSDNDFILLKGNFRELVNLINQAETKGLEFKGMIFDLGVSSLQLEDPERGFSFGKSGPLDMRMDPDLPVRALDLIKGLNKGELYELFTKLGEEKFAKSIADTIISSRQMITTTTDLSNIISKVVRSKSGKIHPATKVFQALRIAVNDELNALKEGLPQSLAVLNDQGRVVVVSFHSLEDRIVKNTFKAWEAEGRGRSLTKKPLTPTEWEIRDNPRSRSAKMRVFEKGVRA